MADTVKTPQRQQQNVNHTPKPWRVLWPDSPNAMSEVVSGPKSDPYRVAWVLRDSNPHQQPIDDANARLIAAAPELLAACKDALEGLLNISNSTVRENRCFNGTPKANDCRCSAHTLRRAIATAEVCA